MRQLAGLERSAIARDLVEAYDAVASGGGPLVVSLEGPLGFGKTRLVQELYERLATTRQGAVPYWPRTLDWKSADGSSRPDLLQARKVVEPAPGWVIPGGTEIPWLWWAISCQLSHSGNPMRAMKDASDQLRVHLDPIQRRLAKTTRNRDDALQLLGGLFDLAGVVNPGSFIDAGQSVVGVFRRRLRQAFTVAESAMDRRVETHDESYSEAARVATGLTEVAQAGIPVLLIVDDAQWADPGLVSLLRYLAVGDASRILVVATTWADHDRTGRGPAETFGAWLESIAATRPELVRRVPLGPLPDEALGEMVLALAPRTDPDAVRQIAALAAGNPLVLNLLLDLDLIRQDIAADGSIDTDPERLRKMPSNLQAIYQDLWRQLPTAVQRLLVLVAIQGPEFLPGFVERAASRLGIHEELVPALGLARDRYHWVRAVNDDRWEFTEPQRHRVAFDHVNEVFAPEQLDLIRGAIIDQVVALKVSKRWTELDARTRRVALESHLEADEDLAAGSVGDPAALSDSRIQLAALELDAGNPGRAVELIEGALSSDGLSGEDLDRSRGVLAQGLVATGRAADAVPLLASVGAAEAFPEVQAAAIEEAASYAADAAVVDSGVDEWGRIPWTAWTERPVGSLADMAPSEAGALVCEVVASEGPVHADRIFDVLRVASGAPRQTRPMRAALDAGIRSAVRRGQLTTTTVDALGRAGHRTLRLPTQPEVVLRTMGPRSPDDVPRREIAELARHVGARDPGLDRTALKRSVGSLLGQKLMTKTLDQLLESAIPETTGGDAVPAAAAGPAVDAWGRAPWTGWAPEPVPMLSGLKPAEVGSWIERVAAAEGPLTAGRAFALVARAGGAPKLSSSVVDALESGLGSAVRGGRVVVTPGRRGAPETRTLRLPSQPEVLPRLPGDRAPAEIPKAELADLAARVTAQYADWDRAAVKREVARLIGIGRYTDAADQLLEWAIA